MNEFSNEVEEFEIDEAVLKKIARKYTLKTTAAVFTVIIAIVAIMMSYFYFAVNNQIIATMRRADGCFYLGNYSQAVIEYDSAQKLVDSKNEIVPVFRTGRKVFWSKMEVYSRVNGPIKCKALLDKYYPDGNYPVEAQRYIYNAEIYEKAYNELNTVVYKTSKDYSEAYEGIERVASENPDYPEYIILYFHLLATQAFEESAASQISAFNALEDSAPDATWLYASAGTKALIKNNELSKALRLCPDSADEEANATHIKIYRLMGEYKEAGMLYDEYRDYDASSEALDREMLIINLLEGKARQGIKACSYYTENLNNCETSDMIYTLWIASVKANDKKLEKKITDYAKTKKIPEAVEVTGYKLGDLDLNDIFLDGECDLS